MDSKGKAIVFAILAIFLIGVMIFLFVGEATNKSVLTVGKESYDLSDFESYIKVWTYEGDQYSGSVDDMYKAYQSYKIYYNRAAKAGVTLEDGEKPSELESGDKETLLADYNLSEDEYMRVQTEIALANKLYGSAYELGKIDKANFEYNKQTILESSPNAFDTLSYRVVELQLPQDITVEDEDAEVSGEVSGETAEEKTARQKAETKANIEKVLEIAKEYVALGSGESTTEVVAKLAEIIPAVSGDEPLPEDLFEYIGNNTEVIRYTQNTLGFQTVANGGLDTASRLFMEEDLTGDRSYVAMFGGADLAKKIVSNIAKLKEGEFSPIFETEEGYAFIYLEKVENELNEDDNTRYLNEVANSYIGQTANMTFNKTLVKSIDLEKLMPKVARDAEEARKQAEEAANASENAVERTEDANELPIDIQVISEEVEEVPAE